MYPSDHACQILPIHIDSDSLTSFKPSSNQPALRSRDHHARCPLSTQECYLVCPIHPIHPVSLSQYPSKPQLILILQLDQRPELHVRCLLRLQILHFLLDILLLSYTYWIGRGSKSAGISNFVIVRGGWSVGWESGVSR